MKQNTFPPELTTDLFRELLDAEYASPSMLVYAAKREHRRLPTLLLSVFESEGEPLGSGARDELRRARERARDYRELHEAISEVAECRALKGAYLAGLYPKGLRRPVGDLDLVFADEPSLWRGVRRALDLREVTQIGFALHGEEGREIGIELHWSSEDDLLDGTASAEFHTAALPGDSATVPVRSALPENAWAAGLLGLAEERFQRPFGIRDAIDVYMMAACAPAADEVVEALRGCCREPEIVELLTYTGGLLDIGPLKPLSGALSAPADEEIERRARESRRPGVPSDEEDVVRRFSAGLPVQGFMLRRRDDRPDWSGVRRHEFSHGWIAMSPIGDFLLCGGEVVARDAYEAALEELELIEGDAE